MCNPIAAMVGMALVSAGTQYMQQREAAKAAQERERQAMEAAMAQRRLEEEQLQQNLKEARSKADTDKFSVAREAAKQRGTIMAASSEAGAFGNVLLAQLAESMMQEGYDKSIIDYNYRQTLENADLRRKAYDLNAQNTINANKAPKTSGLLSGLQIGASAFEGAMSGYNMYQSVKGLSTTGSKGPPPATFVEYNV